MNEIVKKRNWGLTIAVVIGISVSSLAQDAQKFTVTGQVKNPVAGRKIYLEAGQPARRIDSAQVDANGKFTINGIEKDGGSFYQLNLFGKQRAGLLIEGGETLQVSADLSEGSKTPPVVTGSKNMEFYQRIMAIEQEMREKSRVWQKEYSEANQKADVKRMEAISQESDAANKKATDAIRKMIPEMGTSLVAIMAINYLNPEEDFTLYETLAKNLDKQKATGRQARAFMENVARLQGLMVGSVAPDISLNDPNGKPVALSSLRGKYVLIDFWASWCGPCRQENPNVVRMYNKFKDKGFAIYGVSLDRDKDNWVKAIEKDGLTWTHVSDLKFWQSAAAQQYGVRAIPATFLLDREGKIIARNLRGQALEDKLAEVLK